MCRSIKEGARRCPGSCSYASQLAGNGNARRARMARQKLVAHLKEEGLPDTAMKIQAARPSVLPVFMAELGIDAGILGDVPMPKIGARSSSAGPLIASAKAEQQALAARQIGSEQVSLDAAEEQLADAQAAATAIETSTATRGVPPTEAIGEIGEDSYAALADELLDRIVARSSTNLEILALKLLDAMGYCGHSGWSEHTGKPGDDGIDGVVHQDPLGLDRIGMQAKRYKKNSSVHKPEVQAFVGALQGIQCSRGVLVTTGRFSDGARKYAQRVDMRLSLIDGTELTKLMMRYNLCV